MLFNYNRKQRHLINENIFKGFINGKLKLDIGRTWENFVITSHATSIYELFGDFSTTNTLVVSGAHSRSTAITSQTLLLTLR